MIKYTELVNITYRVIVVLLLGLIATLLWNMEKNDRKSQLVIIEKLEGINHTLNMWELIE